MRSLKEAFAGVLAPGGKAVIFLLSPDSLPNDLYLEDTMRFRTLRGDTYTTPITRWRTPDIHTAFREHLEVQAEVRVNVGVRDFALFVFRLARRG